MLFLSANVLLNTSYPKDVTTDLTLKEVTKTGEFGQNRAKNIEIFNIRLIRVKLRVHQNWMYYFI